MAVQLETLCRGLVAVKTGEGVFLSWRFLREEARGAEKERLTGADFIVLRDGAEIVEDEENGLWTYEGDGLKITVQRFTETVTLKKNKRTREYCVADIQGDFRFRGAEDLG